MVFREEVICDNGKQFTSREYQDFAAKYGFKLTTSSPYYPKGHGFIERQVQTIKNLLSKCDKDGSGPTSAEIYLTRQQDTFTSRVVTQQEAENNSSRHHQAFS